jgi:hypothetical protein
MKTAKPPVNTGDLSFQNLAYFQSPLVTIEVGDKFKTNNRDPACSVAGRRITSKSNFMNTLPVKYLNGILYRQ